MFKTFAKSRINCEAFLYIEIRLRDTAASSNSYTASVFLPQKSQKLNTHEISRRNDA